jgi:ABC-type molybdenum transport system ATPase subunit/photorepair protein PhrA
VTVGSPGITNIQVTINKPLYNASNSTSTPNSPDLSDYRIVLCNTAIQTRRYNETTIASLVATCNVTYSGTPQNYTINNLKTDTTYLVNVSARNVVNANYGNIVIIQQKVIFF